MIKSDFFRCAAFAAVVAFIPLSPAHAQSAFDDPGSRTASGGSGDITVASDKAEAGDVVVGSTSQIVVLLRNDDNKPLKTGAINLYPSSNVTAAIGENQCAAKALDSGEVCAIAIEVKGLQIGRFRVEMLMRHEGRAKLLTTAVNGSVVSSGDKTTDLISDIEMIPTEIDFGSLKESTSQMRAVILRNKTSKSIDIEDISVESGLQSGLSVTSNCKTLQTGAACVASVMWAPQKKGPTTGTVIVRHSGATEISTVDLKGEYDPTDSEKAEIFPEAIPGKGLLVSTREEVDFGSGVAQSSSISTSLVNVGDMPLTLTDVRMANAENGVRAERSGCSAGTVLAPLEACALTMTWEPVREGSIVDDIQVSHTGARGILILPIRGSAARAINKDAKAISLTGAVGPEAIIRHIQPLSIDDVGGLEDDEGVSASAPRKASSGGQTHVPSHIAPGNVRGVLDGYVITSYSPQRAIVAGPGGSRVVFNGEQTVIGGILWEISMRPSSIEFKNGDQKVLLLFDRSLSSFNVLDAQSSSGNASLNNQGSSTSSTSSTSTQ